jgi:hypothetical protein
MKGPSVVVIKFISGSCSLMPFVLIRKPLANIMGLANILENMEIDGNQKNIKKLIISSAKRSRIGGFADMITVDDAETIRARRCWRTHRLPFALRLPISRLPSRLPVFGFHFNLIREADNCPHLGIQFQASLFQQP